MPQAPLCKQFNTKCAALSASNCLKLAICVIMLLKYVATYFMLESDQKVCWFKCEQGDGIFMRASKEIV